MKLHVGTRKMRRQNGEVITVNCFKDRTATGRLSHLATLETDDGREVICTEETEDGDGKFQIYETGEPLELIPE